MNEVAPDHQKPEHAQGRGAKLVGIAGRIAGYGLATAIVTSPIMAERAIENASFNDYLGTIPVEVQLSHNGYSTIETGLFDDVYFDKTGAFGFGVTARATGPPEAGGTLASYVSPKFIQSNIALTDNPQPVIDAYSDKLRMEITANFLRNELLAGVVGGLVIGLARSRRHPQSSERTLQQKLVPAVVLLGATGASTMLAAHEFHTWSEKQTVATTYPLPGVEGVSFGSPQVLEIAQQIRPFVEKNTARMEIRANAYEDTATVSLFNQLQLNGADLMPRDGEAIIIAEADPQGSFVGTRVRRVLYQQLSLLLGSDAIAFRTISGDVSSNGTVAEARYIEEEIGADGGISTVVIGGDHDSETTWEQMEVNEAIMPDLETVEVNGLLVAGAHDREHKTLFGGMVTNNSGISEKELGEELRENVPDDKAVTVLVHQPDAAAGYLGMDSLAPIIGLPDSKTVPVDDGIADIPSGSLNIGHRHDAEGPWVVWNTDGDTITWTVIDQLGTAGGVEESPTFNRFSTPFSPPLKTLSIRFHFVNKETGLVTGYATINFDTAGNCEIVKRTDIGLPGGEPLELSDAQEGNKADKIPASKADKFRQSEGLRP